MRYLHYRSAVNCTAPESEVSEYAVVQRLLGWYQVSLQSVAGAVAWEQICKKPCAVDMGPDHLAGRIRAVCQDRSLVE